MLSKKSFELLRDIETNNNKRWYDANRNDFKDHVRTPFAKILVTASKRLEKTDRPLIGHEKTMFRQNRDTRFSEDKSPYKTNVSGMLTPSGTKNEATGLIYLQVAKDGGFTAAGRYKLNVKALEPIREDIIQREKAFEVVLKDLKKAGLSFLEEDKLKSMPRGFSEYQKHRHAEYLKLTSLIVRRDLPKRTWLTTDIADELVKMAQQTQSLLEFIDV